MKNLLLLLLFTVLGNQLFSQQFYLDSISNEQKPEESAKYYYNSDYTIKQIVDEDDVLSYEYLNESTYDILSFSRHSEREYRRQRIELDDSDRVILDARFDIDDENESEYYRDNFKYENDLLVEHINLGQYSLGGLDGFWNNFTTLYTYDENNKILLYEKDILEGGLVRREYIRENDILLQVNTYAAEAGHLAIDTSYFNPSNTDYGWRSHGMTIVGFEDEVTHCDSTFRFNVNENRRAVFKEDDYCSNFYEVRYYDTILSSSSLIPFEYSELGYLDSNLVNPKLIGSKTYSVDSTLIQEGKYTVNKIQRYYGENNEVYAEYLIQYFYIGDPDMGEFQLVDIPEELASLISISPNPIGAGQSLKIEMDESAVDEILLMDHTGSVISTHQVGNVVTYFLQFPFQPGMYFLSFHSGGEFLTTKKVLVY